MKTKDLNLLEEELDANKKLQMLKTLEYVMFATCVVGVLFLMKLFF